MRSSLAGIPIVSPAWIHACVGEQKAVLPYEGLCATGLPTKNEILQSTGESHWGIARMAASLRQGGSLPLQDSCLALLGNFSEQTRKDLQALAKHGGAKVLTKPDVIFARLSRPYSGRLVVVCHDQASGTLFSPVLYSELRMALEADPSAVGMVNPQWIFDSIACSRELGTRAFGPKHPEAKKLWELSK